MGRRKPWHWAAENRFWIVSLEKYFLSKWINARIKRHWRKKRPPGGERTGKSFRKQGCGLEVCMVNFRQCLCTVKSKRTEGSEHLQTMMEPTPGRREGRGRQKDQARRDAGWSFQNAPSGLMRRSGVKTVPGGAEQGWPQLQADSSCRLGRWTSLHTPGSLLFLKETVSSVRLWMLHPEVWPAGRLEKSPVLSGRISLAKAPRGDLEIPNKLRERGWGSWNRQQFSKVTNMGTKLPGTATVVCPWVLGKVRKSGVGGSGNKSQEIWGL